MTALYIILAAVAYVAACFIIYSLMRVSSDADKQAERLWIEYELKRCETCRYDKMDWCPKYGSDEDSMGPRISWGNCEFHEHR